MDQYMKKIVVALVLLTMCTICQAKQTSSIADESQFQDRYILILKSTKDYKEALVFASEASKRLGLKFENSDTKYSKEKGIYFSEHIDDEASRGEYFPRRYTEEYVSLENSSSYGKNWTPDLIIVVSGVYDTFESGKKSLDNVRKFYKKAYLKKSNIWMGCIH